MNNKYLSQYLLLKDSMNLVEDYNQNNDFEEKQAWIIGRLYYLYMQYYVFSNYNL